MSRSPRDHRRLGATLAGVVLLAACQPPPPGLLPLEQPTALQAAAPRISGAIPTDVSQQRAYVEHGRSPATISPAPGMSSTTPGASPAGGAPPTGVAGEGGDITLNFVDTDIRVIARTILGSTLKVSYTIDPSVHGTGSIETGTPLPRSALLPTLETLLNQNGATLVQRDGVYSVVPIPVGAATNPVSGAASVGAGAQVVLVRYTSAKDLAKVLEPYVAEGGKIASDDARNALLVSGDAAVRQTLVGLIRAFDTDLLTGQSYAMFPVRDGDPGKLAGELQTVLQAQSQGPLAGLVRVVPMERVNAVLVVSSQPRYIDAASRFFNLASRVAGASARAWHVYYVQSGQSADLENLLQRAFTPNHVSPTPAPPGSTTPNAAPLSLGTSPTSGGGTAGGGGATGTSTGLAAGAAGAGGGGLSGGAGATGGLGAGITPLTATSEAQSPATEPLGGGTEGGNAGSENRIRIIANRVNNALLIYATPPEYSVIEGMLHKIDIIPLQVLIEATIAEVDLNDQLQYGTQFFFKTDHFAETLGVPGGSTIPQLGSLNVLANSPYFVLSKAPNFALSALAAVTKVKVLSAPQVMVLDNQPASLQVGQQVPVLTGQATSNLAAGAPTVNSVDYHETGVIMQVTPRVNSSGLVTLDIAQEVSDVAAAAANTVQGSPTFDDQVFRTRVAVQDGQTVGMAGLIRDNVSEGNSGIPLLKDIPVIGTLFSTQANQRARTELLVLITPHVVHDQRDARALTEDLRNQVINAGLVPQQLQRRGVSGSSNPNGL